MRPTPASPNAETGVSSPSVRRRLATLLAGAALAAIGTLAPVPPARADFRFSEPLRNQKNEGFCIGIGGGSKESGAQAKLFRCDGLPNQANRFFGTIHSATIVNNNSKLCLRIRGNSFENGALLVQGSCGSKSAEWELTNLRGGLESRLASIRNRHTGKCIGVPGGNLFHDAELKVFNCDLGDFGNQNWVVNQNRSRLP